MKVSVEQMSEIKRKIQVELPEQRVKAELQKTYSRLNRTAKIKGFRAGKVPISILKRYYEDQVLNDVGLQLINDTIMEALRESRMEVISQTELEREPLHEGEPFRYSVVVEVKPEIVIKDYQKIPVRRRRPLVSDRKVENELELRRQAGSYLRSPEQARPIKPGDHVLLDFTSYTEGRPVKGGDVKGFQLEVGANQFNAEFEAKLIGASKDDQRQIEVTFPSDYGNKKLAGKHVTFQVDIKDVKERVLPYLDDEFARDLGEFQNLDELRIAIRRQLEDQEKRRIDGEVEQQLVDALIARNPFEIPEGMVEQELQRMLDTIRYRLSAQNLTLEKAGVDENVFRQQQRDRAERAARSSAILERLAVQENLEVTEEELEERIRINAEEIQQPHEKVRAFYAKSNLMDSLRRQVLREKLIKLLTDQAEITEVEDNAAATDKKLEGDS
jgi:trigger factor